jgi:hypothetical protein
MVNKSRFLMNDSRRTINIISEGKDAFGLLTRSKRLDETPGEALRFCTNMRDRSCVA